MGARRRQRGAWIHRLFWLGVAGLALWFSFERVVRPTMSSAGYRRVEGYRELIVAAAGEAGIDANLLAGVALAESSGRPDVVSSAGALGMFQLMLPTARERAALLKLPEPTRDDLLRDPALNGRLAANYLRWLTRRYSGNTEAALCAYNAGPGRVDGWIRERGSYDAWRAERVGESAVLGYAQKVLQYRDVFAQRAVIVPPPAGPNTAQGARTPTGAVGTSNSPSPKSPRALNSDLDPVPERPVDPAADKTPTPALPAAPLPAAGGEREPPQHVDPAPVRSGP